VELIVLGAHGTWPPSEGATSGYLVRHDGYDLWVDMGSGTMANLQRYTGMFDVDAVAVSHVHPDHLVDLYMYFFARVFSPERPTGTPLFVPPGLLELFVGLLQDDAMQEIANSFKVVEVSPGDPFEAGPFRVSTWPMAHPVPTLGMRIEADGEVLSYTADTGPTDEVGPLAQGADLLLAEATWQQPEQETDAIHLTAKQAGDVAAGADARRLMLTHIRPHLDRERSREDAASRFGGEVLLAEEAVTVEIGK
jgi:ribonuclease BN (tRNA processing enzyme)